MGLKPWTIVLAWLALSAFQLPPHKDELFGYPPAVDQAHDGAFKLLAYDKQIHIGRRDAVPLRKANPKYISRVGFARRRTTYKTSQGAVKAFRVGHAKTPRVVVIYVHGRGGNRRWGVSDDRFGGNFNRLQHLMIKGRGRLISPDITDFGAGGARMIADIADQQPKSAKIIVACGSQGSFLCWELSRGPLAATLDGMVILGGVPDAKAGGDFPIVLAHGTADNVYAYPRVKRFYEQLRRLRPVRLRAFTNGVHGTPVRMIDWRKELNWILGQG